MVVIIDNYDSFTYNLALYFEELNQNVVVFKNDQVTVADIEVLGATKLVISPGPCTPNESGVSLALIDAFTGRLPILGVCLGHQAVAQRHGAKIVRAKRIMHGKLSTIHTQQNSILFNRCARSFQVTRYHSLMVDWETLPEDFTVSAWCEDKGKKTVMAIENKRQRLYGVQFHPESLLTEYGHNVLENFLLCG
ncbi:MAG: aminodeoxychorismate/anthranilate synthase component II [Pseudomonadota bacterium]